MLMILFRFSETLFLNGLIWKLSYRLINNSDDSLSSSSGRGVRLHHCDDFLMFLLSGCTSVLVQQVSLSYLRWLQLCCHGDRKPSASCTSTTENRKQSCGGVLSLALVLTVSVSLALCRCP